MANVLNKLNEARQKAIETSKKTFEATKKVSAKVTIISEFKDFLKEYKVVGLAVAFVMGVAVTALVNSIVANLIMPIVTFFLPNGTWQTAVWKIGTVAIGWGQMLNAVINFIIIAWVVFMIAKVILKEDKVTKK